MAVVTFGGAYAVLAYVAQQAVETYGWLQPGEMLDGLGMAETTPGPLIMVLQFVGFLGAFRDPGALPPLLAGTLGGLLTTWVTFVPCFLWIFLGAPFIETLRGNRALAGGARGDHRGGRRRDPQPRGLVRAPHPVRAGARAALGTLALDVPILATMNLPALVLTLAAMLAVFRFRARHADRAGRCRCSGLALPPHAGQPLSRTSQFSPGRGP